MPTRGAAAILTLMLFWVAVAACVSFAVLVATGGLSVRRYSGSHLVAHLAVAGRGLYISRTPDGLWWRVRLRPRRRRCEDRSGWDDPPPDVAVREPRRPLGPEPFSAATELELPPEDWA